MHSYDDFKFAIKASLESEGLTRNDLALRMEEEGILRAHTVRCLLGAPGTRNGSRVPNFRSALQVAHAAGFDLVLQKRV
jgi:hypothetical protein